MSSPTSPLGKSSELNPSGSTTTPSYTERAKQGLLDVKDTFVSYTPKIVRESSILSYITWPFSAFASLLGAIRARISNAIWGPPKAVTTIKFESKGYVWNSTYDVPIEDALTKGYITFQEAIEKGHFTEERARIDGLVLVEIPGRVYNSKMLLKDAIIGGYMTVDEAFKAGHFTEAHAKQATWLQLKEKESV